MEEKKKLLSKLNIKDYKNDLEQVLEKKQFDEEAKSLILNIFYKLDNFYKDYSTVKIECAPKNEFLEDYINTIKNKCNKIKILKPQQLKKDQKYIINREKGEIQSFPSEIILLYAINELSEKKLSMEKSLLEDFTNICLSNVLNKGMTINSTEPIRDFTGWSWNIELGNNNNITVNQIFLNFLILLGYNFAKQNIRKNNLLKLLNEKINSENYDKQSYNFQMDLLEICILIYNNQSKENHEKCLEYKKNLINKKNMLKSRKDYLEDKTKSSSNISKQIQEIDKMLNDIKLIRKEFEKSLEENKYLGLSDFVEGKEKEKQNLLVKIKENNKVLSKKQYLINHDDYENTLKLYELIIEDKEKVNLQTKLVKFQRDFLECFKLKIEKAELKRDLYNLTAIMRYYANIPFQKDKQLTSQARISAKFEEVSKELIKKLIENKVIDTGFKNEKFNYEILKYIFKTKVIELENLTLKISFISKKQIKVEYYDADILDYEEVLEIPFDEEITNQKDKKMKLFKLGG